MFPRELVGVQAQRFEVGELSQIRGYLARQLIAAQPQLAEIPELAQFRGYLPGQFAAQPEKLQLGETSQHPWNPPPEPRVGPTQLRDPAFFHCHGSP